MDVTSDVISIATISGAATSFGARNRFRSGPGAVDVYSAPYPEFKPAPTAAPSTVLTPPSVTPSTAATSSTSVSSVTASASLAPAPATSTASLACSKGGEPGNSDNGKVVTIYSFEEGCEEGKGEGHAISAPESSTGLGVAIKKPPVAPAVGQAMDKGGELQETEGKGFTARRGILGRVRGDSRQTQRATSPPSADSSTLINAKAGTCSYSSNGNSNRAVTFDMPGVSLTDASTDLEGECRPLQSCNQYFLLLLLLLLLMVAVVSGVGIEIMFHYYSIIRVCIFYWLRYNLFVPQNVLVFPVVSLYSFLLFP